MHVDAYNATVVADPLHVLRNLTNHLSEQYSDVTIGRQTRLANRWSYAHCVPVLAGRAVLANVRWGGNGGGVSVEIKGKVAAHAHVELRRRYPGHACTHLDVAFDLSAQGLFDEMFVNLRRIAMAKRVDIRRVGDWDYFQRGRSVYFGALTSVMQVILYEKGLERRRNAQVKDADKNAVRLELRVRPQTRELKLNLGAISPHLAWSLSPWTMQAALTFATLAEKPASHIAHSLDKPTALAMMFDQYHRVLEHQFGTNWDKLGETAATECARRRTRGLKRSM